MLITHSWGPLLAHGVDMVEWEYYKIADYNSPVLVVYACTTPANQTRRVIATFLRTYVGGQVQITLSDIRPDLALPLMGVAVLAFLSTQEYPYGVNIPWYPSDRRHLQRVIHDLVSGHWYFMWDYVDDNCYNHFGPAALVDPSPSSVAGWQYDRSWASDEMNLALDILRETAYGGARRLHVARLIVRPFPLIVELYAHLHAIICSGDEHKGETIREA
jgi:hypothetical protein